MNCFHILKLCSVSGFPGSPLEIEIPTGNIWPYKVSFNFLACPLALHECLAFHVSLAKSLYVPCSILSSHSSSSNALREKKKKKSTCPSAHFRSVQCFLLFMFILSSLSQLSNGFRNMVAKLI